MAQSPSWLVLAGIVATATVSIFSVFVPYWLEHQRMVREDARRVEEGRLAQLDEIVRTALDFLNVLSFLKVQTTQELSSAVHQSNVAVNIVQAASVLQSRFYSWESKIWEKLGDEDRERVKKLRTMIEKTQVPYASSPHVPNPFASEVAGISDEVLSLNRKATGRE